MGWFAAPPKTGEIYAIFAGMTADKKREKGVDFTHPFIIRVKWL